MFIRVRQNDAEIRVTFRWTRSVPVYVCVRRRVRCLGLLISPHHMLAIRRKAKTHRCRCKNVARQCFLIKFSMLLSVGAVNRGSTEEPLVEFATALPCCMWSKTMCVVLVVCVFALAVYAPSLMEDFSEVTMEKTNISLKSAILKRLNMLIYYHILNAFFILLIIHLQVAYNWIDPFVSKVSVTTCNHV